MAQGLSQFKGNEGLLLRAWVGEWTSEYLHAEREVAAIEFQRTAELLIKIGFAWTIALLFVGALTFSSPRLRGEFSALELTLLLIGVVALTILYRRGRKFAAMQRASLEITVFSATIDRAIVGLPTLSVQERLALLRMAESNTIERPWELQYRGAKVSGLGAWWFWGIIFRTIQRAQSTK